MYTQDQIDTSFAHGGGTVTNQLAADRSPGRYFINDWILKVSAIPTGTPIPNSRRTRKLVKKAKIAYVTDNNLDIPVDLAVRLPWSVLKDAALVAFIAKAHKNPLFSKPKDYDIGRGSWWAALGIQRIPIGALTFKKNIYNPIRAWQFARIRNGISI